MPQRIVDRCQRFGGIFPGKVEADPVQAPLVRIRFGLDQRQGGFVALLRGEVFLNEDGQLFEVDVIGLAGEGVGNDLSGLLGTTQVSQLVDQGGDQARFSR